MPFGPTTMLEPFSAKSVVSPEIDQVTVLPSPPVTLSAETTVPAAAPQASVALGGVNATARGAWTVMESVAVALPAKAGEAIAQSMAQTGMMLPINFIARTPELCFSGTIRGGTAQAPPKRFRIAYFIYYVSH